MVQLSASHSKRKKIGYSFFFNPKYNGIFLISFQKKKKKIFIVTIALRGLVFLRDPPNRPNLNLKSQQIELFDSEIRFLLY